LRGKRWVAAGSLLVLALLSGASANRAEPSLPAGLEVAVYREDFEDGEAQGWQIVRLLWEVVRDADGNRVFHGQGHNWALYSVGSWECSALSLRVRLVRGTIHLNFRLSNSQGGNRYYVAFGEGRVSLMKNTSGTTFRELQARPGTHRPTRWYDVRITEQGGKLDVYVDGALTLTATDADPLTYGTIGLETLEDSEAYVDDIEVLAQPASSAVAAANAPLDLVWTSTGGPRGGIGYDIRIHPTNPDVMWTSDAYAGAFRSMNGGQTWRGMNEGITARTGPSGDAIPIFSLAINERQPDILWAGTQGMRGVFKSTDGGVTWSKMESGIETQNAMEIRSFSVDPQNPDVVYMGGNYTPDPSKLAVRGLIYKTTDGGRRWTKLLEPGALVRWILIDPGNTNVIYAATGIFDRVAVKPEGILRSADGGRSWSSINTGLTNLVVGGLAMDPRNSQVLIAVTGKSICFVNEKREIYGAVFKTADGGQHWRKVYPRAEGYEVMYSAVAFAPSDPDVVYVDAGWEFLRSQDGGESWTRFETGSGPLFPEDRGRPISLAVHPNNPDLVFMNAYDGGVFRSDDGGRTWVDSSSGVSGSQSWDVATCPVDPQYVLAATKNGIYESLDRGSSWHGRNTTGGLNCALAVALDPTDPSKILVGNEIQGCILMSTDGGLTWRKVLSDLGENTPTGRRGIYQIAFAPSQPSVVYAVSAIGTMTVMVPRETKGRGVFKSTDGGQSWLPVNQGLEAAALNILALAIHPQNPDLVYVGTLGKGVFRTTNGGRTWSKSGSGIPPIDVRSVAIDSANPDIVYAGTDGMALFRSTDGGQTWQRSSTGLNPEASMRSIVVDPVRMGHVYAADRRSGVYRSTDSGRSWVQVTEGLTMRAVNRLAITPDGGTLYAATEGSGIFRLALSALGQ